jgi:hypothetical protein
LKVFLRDTWGRWFEPDPIPLQLEPLDDIGQFLASHRFEQRGKLDQLGIEIGSID